jgi:hypothetical protein
MPLSPVAMPTLALAGGPGFPYGLSHKIPPEGETQMAYSLYDAAVTPCAQQLGALVGIID